MESSREYSNEFLRRQIIFSDDIVSIIPSKFGTTPTSSDFLDDTLSQLVELEAGLDFMTSVKDFMHSTGSLEAMEETWHSWRR